MTRTTRTMLVSACLCAAAVAFAATPAQANGGRGRSYTATGPARLASDPPSYFIGGFSQLYTAPTPQAVFYAPQAANVVQATSSPVFVQYLAYPAAATQYGVPARPAAGVRYVMVYPR